MALCRRSSGAAANGRGRTYYAMLYAARAALSERDLSARTHAGTWAAFREAFVLTGQIGENIARDAQRAQSRREASDYGAASFDLAEARDVVAGAERLLAAVERQVGG